MQKGKKETSRRFGETPEEALSLYSDQGIYGSIDYGSPAVNKGLVFAVLFSQQIESAKNKPKILCLGSGNAYEAIIFLKQGFDCYIAEIYHPKLDILKGRQIKAFGQNLPFRDKFFDAVFSCETMEHIPEQFADMVLSEAKRVSKEVYFSIATVDDPYETHICIHNAQWWMDKFEQLGFDFINAQLKPRFPILLQEYSGKTAVKIMFFAEGVLIHARC